MARHGPTHGTTCPIKTMARKKQPTPKWMNPVAQKATNKLKRLERKERAVQRAKLLALQTSFSLLRAFVPLDGSFETFVINQSNPDTRRSVNTLNAAFELSQYLPTTKVRPTMTITLISKDGDKLEAPNSMISISRMLSDATSLQDDDVSDEIPIKFSSVVLKHIFSFCEHYASEKMKPIQIPLESTFLTDIVQDWYNDFVTNLAAMDLFELVEAANYLDIKDLLDLACLAIAIKIKDKNEEELLALYHAERGEVK